MDAYILYVVFLISAPLLTVVPYARITRLYIHLLTHRCSWRNESLSGTERKRCLNNILSLPADHLLPSYDRQEHRIIAYYASHDPGRWMHMAGCGLALSHQCMQESSLTRKTRAEGVLRRPPSLRRWCVARKDMYICMGIRLYILSSKIWTEAAARCDGCIFIYLPT
ncbi:hypothetical protein F4779DRAFT_344090 [Xylariaceae sp. FL0662B]|nr:hypothetical protein F4779DRAFT_344090 [Xylariaceae sp. FL0662B]